MTAAHRAAEQAQAQRWRAATGRIPGRGGRPELAAVPRPGAGAVGGPELPVGPGADLDRPGDGRPTRSAGRHGRPGRPGVAASGGDGSARSQRLARRSPAGVAGTRARVARPRRRRRGRRPSPARFGSDQIVTLHVRGLADRSSQAQGLADHLIRVWPTAHDEEGTDEEDDLNAVVMRFAPVVDVRAAADRIDFGRAVADPGRPVDHGGHRPRRRGPDRQPAATDAGDRAAPRRPSCRRSWPPARRWAFTRGASWAAATVLAREGRRYPRPLRRRARRRRRVGRPGPHATGRRELTRQGRITAGTCHSEGVSHEGAKTRRKWPTSRRDRDRFFFVPSRLRVRRSASGAFRVRRRAGFTPRRAARPTVPSGSAAGFPPPGTRATAAPSNTSSLISSPR